LRLNWSNEAHSTPAGVRLTGTRRHIS
jgi:hypothetical protein